MTETLAVRTFACKLLETVARRCAARGEPVPPDYTKALNTISDDTHPVVRAAAAQTVPVAAEHPDLGRDCMLAYQQRLTAMLADKDDDVRAAAVLALAQLLERLETAELSAVATPLYRAYTAVRGVQGEAMAHAFGLVFYHLRGHLSAKQTAQLLVYYNTLCASDSSSHCYWAAYNLPVRALCETAGSLRWLICACFVSLSVFSPCLWISFAVACVARDATGTS